MNVHKRNNNYTINYDSSNVSSAQYSFRLPFINDDIKNKNNIDKAYLQIIHYNYNKGEQFKTTEKKQKTKIYISKQTQISLKKKKKKLARIKEISFDMMQPKKKVLNEKLLKDCFYGSKKILIDKISNNNEVSTSFLNMKTKETMFSAHLKNSVNDEENSKKYYHLMKLEPDKCYNNIQYNILHLKKKTKKINKSKSQPLFDTKLKEMNTLGLQKLKNNNYKNFVKQIMYANSEVKAIQDQIKGVYNIKI